MKFLKFIIVVCICFISCQKEKNSPNFKTKITSPNKEIEVEFMISPKGALNYTITYKNKTVIDTSSLSYHLKNQAAIGKNFKITHTTTNSVDQNWQMPWGEQVDVRNNYNQLIVAVEETTLPNRKLNIEFKVYDDGIGFRSIFPEQENLKDVFITEENTQFNLTEDYEVWWTPGDWDIYEHLYNKTQLSKINVKTTAKYNTEIGSYIPENAVNTPVTMRSKNGLHLSFHEAGLVDYSGMTLKVDTTNLSLKSVLVGSKNTDYKVKKTTPFSTPWRTIQISEKATELIDSKLIVNLNEPNKIGDISWFKPTKYTGIWWEMHLRKSTWEIESDKHGATTKNVKNLIDFSSENDINAVLVEGWNTGWGNDKNGFDFVTPYADYNLKEVVLHGKEKGVDIIMHHETFSDVDRYIKQQDTAFALMQSLGIHIVKTGYVGNIKPKGEYHHGQFMVNHFNNTVSNGAKYQIAINAHEPIKGTGLRRTYPNTISREALRGQEFNAWSADGGNPPNHLPTVAFTRMLAGPIDYTPGIFNIKFDQYRPNNQVNTTLTHQLALYVVIYSPIQMVADLPEHYKSNPAFQFIRDVGVDWIQTKVINGDVGEFVTITRQEKGTENWFLGSITNEKNRNLKISLDFLDDDQIYEAILYQDGKNAHYKNNPTAVNIKKIEVTKNSFLELQLAAGGGTAVSIIKK